MLTLAFDTCMDKMYVTLDSDGKTVDNIIVSPEKMLSRSPNIHSAIKNILQKNGLTPKDLDLISTNIDAGGFTAIRTCITVARVMAQELDKKLIGVTSFEILQNLPIDYQGKNILVALDARRESAYVAIDKDIKGIMRINDVMDLIKSGDYFIVTDTKLQPIIGGIDYRTLNINLGEIIVKIARSKSQNENGDWGKLQPLYLCAPNNA